MELDRTDYNWQEAFSSAARDRPANVAGSDGATSEPFALADVAQTFAIVDGENDDASWLWLGRLHDGRYAFLTAWCDYTGWG